MQEKVTSFELSKQLHDLSFESDSHCGWWEISTGTYINDEFKVIGDNGNWVGVVSEHYCKTRCVKAYDSYDLLMWLRDNCFPSFTLRGFKDIGPNYFEILEYRIERSKPQDVAAETIIEILKENKNKCTK